MEIIKKFFNDDCIVIGLCHLKCSENEKYFKKSSFQNKDYYLNELFNKSYSENILLI